MEEVERNDYILQTVSVTPEMCVEVIKALPLTPQGQRLFLGIRHEGQDKDHVFGVVLAVHPEISKVTLLCSSLGSD